MGLRTRSCPNNRISPEVGRSRPANCRTNVVLPAPLGPKIPTISPVLMQRSIQSLANTSFGPGYFFVNFTTSYARAFLISQELPTSGH